MFIVYGFKLSEQSDFSNNIKALLSIHFLHIESAGG